MSSYMSQGLWGVEDNYYDTLSLTFVFIINKVRAVRISTSACISSVSASCLLTPRWRVLGGFYTAPRPCHLPP